MLSVQRRVIRQRLGPRRPSVRHLLRALSQQIHQVSDSTTLLESITKAACGVLNPVGCIIWLREDLFGYDEGVMTWIGSKPPLCLTNSQDNHCLQRGVWPVMKLEDRLLGTALFEAGMSLAAPLIYQEELLGWLGVGPPRRGQTYSAEKRSFLEALAGQAALAIHSISLKAKLEASVTQLRRAYQQIIQAQENERRQLAETLHDETLQHLADLSIRLGLLRNQPEIEPASLDRLQTRLSGIDRRLRQVVRGVHPAILADLGLVEGIIAFLETLPSDPYTSPVRIELWVMGFKEWRLPDQILELALYRVTQNAITNALTHGQASHIWIALEWGVSTVEVRIKDNGCGLNITIEEAARAGRFGLLTMRERIEALGGRFVLSSGPGQGTQVIGCVPLASPSPALGHIDLYTFDLD